MNFAKKSKKSISKYCSKILFCGDIYKYFLTKPKINTQVIFSDSVEKRKYQERIFQRINVNVSDYGVLNIHKIGIDVPPQNIFDELLQWNGNSNYWPNNLAKVRRINGKLENIYIYVLGIQRITIPWFKPKLLNIKPLFLLSSIKFQKTPNNYGVDDGRYLLYRCSGGYPIGIFSLYVRSSDSKEREHGLSQLYSVVAFDFYGKKNGINSKIFNPVWKKIHNRVSSNILNRMKFIIENNWLRYIEAGNL